jgi:uncharacterized membrane protein YhaH (DUF805 family)
MDLDVANYLDPEIYLPVGLLGWLLQVVPAAWAVWTARSGLRLARGAYAVSLVLWFIGLTVLLFGLVIGLAYLIFSHDPASDTMPPDPAWFLVIGVVVGTLTSIILVRLLVRRMNDCGIDKKWAYLAVLPYVDFLMFVGFIFYPPSKAPADQDMAPAPALP